MRKSFRVLITMMLALILVCVMMIPALAVVKDDKLAIIKPGKKSTTWYKGEVIPIDLESVQSYSGDFTSRFNLYLCPKGKPTKDAVWTASSHPNSAASIGWYQTKLNTKSLKPGTYRLDVDYWTLYTGDEGEEGYDPLNPDTRLFVALNIKKLKAPTKLKVKAGKKKVTIKYKKAAGAQKYEIYRSKKKSKGYKKRTTTTKAKFVDKKVKKGKRYYYKVRSVRTKYGTVKSKFTKPKRSKKVKK